MTKGYRIIVPSRQRLKNMRTICAMLPTATICVDVREEAAYRATCPDGTTIVTHPAFDGGVKVGNWNFENFDEECLVFLDDDVQHVIGLMSGVKIKDPKEVLQIIENAVNVSTDLDVGVFCWSAGAVGRWMKKDGLPPLERLPTIRAVGMVRVAYGVRGKARARRFDPSMSGRGDADFTLRSLLEDRALLYDQRYYFDCGKAYGGAGGNVGLISKEQWDRATKLLQARWGSYIDLGKAKMGKGTGGVQIRVERRSKATA